MDLRNISSLAPLSSSLALSPELVLDGGLGKSERTEPESVRDTGEGVSVSQIVRDHVLLTDWGKKADDVDGWGSSLPDEKVRVRPGTDGPEKLPGSSGEPKRLLRDGREGLLGAENWSAAELCLAGASSPLPAGGS